MTNTAQPGDIEALVLSVRDLVTQKEPVGRRRRRTQSELLILSQACRVDDDAPAYVPAQEHTPSDKGETPVEVGSNILHLDPSKRTERVTLEAKIVALEAAVTSQSEDWEADEGESFSSDAWAESAFPTPAIDSPEPEVETPVVRSHLVEQLAQEVETAIGIDAQSSVPVTDLDVETLRSMVAEVIREELSGTLGEKITRNVRKLVRREINRVLASKDLT